MAGFAAAGVMPSEPLPVLLGPPDSRPGQGASALYSGDPLGLWWGCKKGLDPTWVTQDRPKVFRPNR